MGFNSVVASAMAARNFAARRQFDKRIFMLCNCNNSLINTATYSDVQFVGGTITTTSPPSSNFTAIRFVGNAQALIGRDIENDFCLTWWSKHEKYNTYYSAYVKLALGALQATILPIYTGNSLILGTTALWGGGACETNTWTYIELCRVNGVLYYFTSGILRYSGALTDTLSGTLGLSNNGMVNNSAGYGFLSQLRMVIGTGGHTSNYAAPSVPYTGFEPLG